MRCPICAALNLKHDHECEAEARATIKRRARYQTPRRKANSMKLFCRVASARRKLFSFSTSIVSGSIRCLKWRESPSADGHNFSNTTVG
jgi:hypothetical protein